jgi:hypothetical protein
MKILFIDHPQYISGSARLWQGLNEILPGSVVLHPYIQTHFGAGAVDLMKQEWFCKMSDEAARGDLPQGIPPFAKGEGLCCGDQTIITQESLAFTPPPPTEIPSEEKLIHELRDGVYDLVVLANSNRVPTIALARLACKVQNMPPIVYYDAGERDELNEHWIHVFRPAIVFKQILTPEVLKAGLSVKIAGYTLRMFPLPLSNMFVDYPGFRLGAGGAEGPSVGELRSRDGLGYKQIDLFYYLGETWPTRKIAVQALDKLRIRRGFRHAKSACFEEYNGIITRSRLAVSMRGSGRDTTRYWEIPLYRTALVSDGTMGCVHPHPFRNGETAVFYDSVDSLVSVVDRYLSDGRDRLDEIAGAGKDHLERFHSTSARAVFFLDRVREVLGIAPSGNQMERLLKWKSRRGWDSQTWEGPVVAANV